MSVLAEKHKREGLIGTIVFHIILLILFMTLGLNYMVPKPEQGILVNFGTTDSGFGSTETNNPGPSEEMPSDDPAQTTVSETVNSDPNPDVLTDDASELEVPDNPDNNPNQSTEQPVQETKPEEPEVQEPERQVDSRITNATNLFGQPGGGESEGDTEGEGNMGQQNGDPNAGAYTGGGGGNGDYALGNRGVLQKPKYKPNCPEEGKVVMRVKVDKNGNTLTAEATRGTTNYAECLVKAAKKSALETKWEPGSDPFDQVGEITYHFVR